MNIFRHLDYRAVIREVIDAQKQVRSGLTFQSVAAVMGIQKSYFSQVLAGRAELNQDQLFLFCEYFELTSEQSEFLILLLEYSRSAIGQRREFLKKKIDLIQTENRESKKHLDARQMQIDPENLTQYYLDPYNQLVHVCLSIEKYRKNPQSLAPILNVPGSKISSVLQRLEKIGVIEIEGDHLTVKISNVHLPRELPVFSSWQSEVRLLSLQRTKVIEKDERYNFTVIFSADESVRKELQDRFLEYLEKAQKLVKPAPSEQVYQMNFDLLRWS